MTKTKFAAELTALTLTAAVALPTTKAQAGYRGWGLAGAAIGTAICSSQQLIRQRFSDRIPNVSTAKPFSRDLSFVSLVVFLRSGS